MLVTRSDGTAIEIRERAEASGAEYAFDLDVLGTSERVTVIARVVIRQSGVQAKVHVKDGADCRRHRYNDHSLCMWFDDDEDEYKWVPADGVAQLVDHVTRHLYQEAVCRAGDPWPGAESPGQHRRPIACTTCGGEGQ